MTEQPIEPRPDDLPRRAYFGAADRAHLANKAIPRDGGTATDLQSIEVGRRGKLAATLQMKAEDVAAAVKSLRALDATGHTEAGIAHLQATARDLDLALENLIDDVAATLGRIRNRRDTLEALAKSAALANPSIGRQVSADALAEAVEAVDAEAAVKFPAPPLIPSPAVLAGIRAGRRA